MRTTTINSKATRAELEHLWVAVLKLLTLKVGQQGASAEMLTVARRFLNNNQVFPAQSLKVRKSLDGLSEAYMKGLVAALAEPGPPSASLLHELRVCLEQNGSASKEEQLPEALTMSVPFKTIQ